MFCGLSVIKQRWHHFCKEMFLVGLFVFSVWAPAMKFHLPSLYWAGGWKSQRQISQSPCKWNPNYLPGEISLLMDLSKKKLELLLWIFNNRCVNSWGMVHNIVVIYGSYAINIEIYIYGMIRGSSYILTPFLARPKICIINVAVALVIVLVVVVAILAVTGVTNLLALSSSCPSAHLLGWYSSEPEFRPAGHQANQLGRPARGLQSAPGKSNTGLPFPPGSVHVCVCVCARASCRCFDLRECVWVCARGSGRSHKGDVPT